MMIMSRIRPLVLVAAVIAIIAVVTGSTTAASWQRSTSIVRHANVYYVYFSPSTPSFPPAAQVVPGNGRIAIVVRRPQPQSLPVGVPLPQPGPSASSGDLLCEPALEAQMLGLINAERTALGLGPLAMHPELVRLARLKSKDMIDQGYFSHQSPTYGSPFDMMRAADITYRVAGENIAGAPSVAQAHAGLMSSPGHRANILCPSFTHVGIGIVRGGPYGLMVTQLFIGQ